MVSTKILFGACGAVAVGASECRDDPWPTQGMGACQARGITLDAMANLWFTTAPLQLESDCSKVWWCPGTIPHGDPACRPVGLDGGEWTNPSGIALDSSNVTSPTIYVSERGRTARNSSETSISPGVKKCVWKGSDHSTLTCMPFGSNWNAPGSLDVDQEGNVFVTEALMPSPPSSPSVRSNGVWKCSPAGHCVLVGSSKDGHIERDVAADSKGNIYVAGTRPTEGGGLPTVFVQKCTSVATCEDFGPTRESMALDLGIAVDVFDNVYIRDEDNKVNSLVRCSPDGLCEDIAPCHGALPGGVMTIQNSSPYGVIASSIWSLVPSDHKPENASFAQLEVRRFELADTILV